MSAVEYLCMCRYGAPEPHLSSHTYTAHTLTYDRCKKIPMWVAEVITRDMVESTVANRKRSNFQPDPEVLACHSAANEDYRGSGWSRGHMAPAGNYKSCQKSMNDTFYLTNILPQDFDNNSGWNYYCCTCLANFHSHWCMLAWNPFAGIGTGLKVIVENWQNVMLRSAWFQDHYFSLTRTKRLENHTSDTK